MNKSDSIVELAKSMAKAQGEMGGAVRGAENPFFKKSYADLGSVIEAVKEPFSKNGLSYVQFPIEDSGRIGIETVLMHESGEWMSNKFTVQLSKQDAQGAGSAITYCRRYGLQAVAGIPSADDDGNAASKAAPKKQVKQQPNPDLDLIADAVKRGDKDFVFQNWSGIISNNWKLLNDTQVSFLNKVNNGEI